MILTTDSHGQIILPGQPHGDVTKAQDALRLRADRTNDMDFDGDPEVYSLSDNFYEGPSTLNS